MQTFRDSFPSLTLCRKQAGSAHSIAVAVRVKNEMAQLPAFWDSLERQTVGTRCERLFLDSGSTDGTVEFLLARDCTVYSIRPEEFSYGRTCNLMMDLSSAPCVLFLSGHTVLEQSDILERLERFFQSHPLASGYMRQIPNPATGCSRYDQAYLERRFPHKEMEFCEEGVKNSFSNAASVVSREAWQRLPFRDVVSAEDQCWAQEHLKLGGKLYYFPQLTVRHSHNDSPEKVYWRVSLAVEGQYGARVMPLRAVYFFAGIFVKILSMGGGVGEAFSYAGSHAHAYLSRKKKS